MNFPSLAVFGKNIISSQESLKPLKLYMIKPQNMPVTYFKKISTTPHKQKKLLLLAKKCSMYSTQQI